MTSVDTGKFLTFLLVDDEPRILELLSALFSRAYKNARIHTATENIEAFELACKYNPDLITTDIMHPGSDGYQFLGLLRSNLQTRYIPVFSLTGQVSPGFNKKHRREAESEELKQYRAGFNRVFPKPFKFDRILEAADYFVMSDARTDYALLNLGTETPTLDYKESVDLSTHDGRACLAKDVIAMANTNGGTIIVGVAERVKGQFEPVGLTNNMLKELEVTSLNKSLHPFMDPRVQIGVRRVTDGGMTFVFLRIPEATDAPVLVKKSNSKASLFQGRIYIRTAAAESSEVTDYIELRQLIDRFREGL